MAPESKNVEELAEVPAAVPIEAPTKNRAHSPLVAAIAGLLVASAVVVESRADTAAAESITPIKMPAAESSAPEPVKSPIFAQPPPPEIVLAEPHKDVHTFLPVQLRKAYTFPSTKIASGVNGGLKLRVPSDFRWFLEGSIWRRPQQRVVSEKLSNVTGIGFTGSFVNLSGGNHELAVFFTPDKRYLGSEIGFVMTEDGLVRFYQSINNNRPDLRWQESIIGRSSTEQRFFNIMVDKNGDFTVNTGTPDFKHVTAHKIPRQPWMPNFHRSSGRVTATAQNMGGSGSAVLDLSSVEALYPA